MRIKHSKYLFALLLLTAGCSDNNDKMDSPLKADIENRYENEQISLVSFPYPLIRWNGQIYKVTDEIVNINKIDKKVGEITVSTLEINKKLTYDNYSNYFPVGTKIFSIKNIDIMQAVAVESGTGQYTKVETESIVKPTS